MFFLNFDVFASLVVYCEIWDLCRYMWSDLEVVVLIIWVDFFMFFYKRIVIIILEIFYDGMTLSNKFFIFFEMEDYF